MTGFENSRWIWGPDSFDNHFMVFARKMTVPENISVSRIRITASFHYELFINGKFINRGPVHGDPKWCLYDNLTMVLAPGAEEIEAVVVVRHSENLHLRYLTPAPPGLRAEITLGPKTVGTDSSWRCMTLPMWDPATAKRGPALDYIELYDARKEPEGWSEKVLLNTDRAPWRDAIPVPEQEKEWGNYQPRPTPLILRQFRRPSSFRPWIARGDAPARPEDISPETDAEPLNPAGAETAYSAEALNKVVNQANAFTFDIGKEYTGFPAIEIEAPAGIAIEISTTERVKNGRPLVYRWETSFSTRYITREGRQKFHPFAWDGFRYIHIVIRGPAEKIRFRQVGCIERRSPLASQHNVRIQDPLLADIFRICEHSIEISSQEHLVDCPSREQSPAWADSLVVAEALWKGYHARGYMRWYLEAWLNAPLDKYGQISGRYPCVGRTWLDFTIIPLLGQLFCKKETGSYYKPGPTVEKALKLKKWYNREINIDGLIEFPFQQYFDKGLRNFIDHPGLGSDDEFPHPGIERDGISCGLNTFYYGFCRILADMAREQGHDKAASLKTESDNLKRIIPEKFFDGKVFHDTLSADGLSGGTAWQTNGLAVLYELVDTRTGAAVMSRMLEGYDRLCRCTPYFQFYFLQALRKTGLEEEALALIKKEWGPMIERGSTTTWELFQDNDGTSLCHPWSTMPYLFLVDNSTITLP